LGLAIGDPSGLVYGADHSLHASSGVRVLPDRVCTSTRVPAGVIARQAMVPQVATTRASFTSES
jgi:hypothetical protein